MVGLIIVTKVINVDLFGMKVKNHTGLSSGTAAFGARASYFPPGVSSAWHKCVPAAQAAVILCRTGKQHWRLGCEALWGIALSRQEHRAENEMANVNSVADLKHFKVTSPDTVPKL